MNPISQYLMIGKLVALLGAVALICFQSSQIHRWHKNATSCAAARHADQVAYAQAQADAQAKNIAQVKNVEWQYQRNSDNEREAYLRDLAKLRADRVRSQGSAAQGSAGRAGAPKDGKPSSGTDADGLQVPPTGDVQADASEIELRLMHLQNWVREQLNIDPNKP